MKLIKTMACFVFLPLSLFSQLQDDFSDGDFHNNPSWTGTTEMFVVNDDLQLQLQDDEANEAFLVTELTTLQEMQWNFYIQLKFSPSANNNARIYLISLHENLHDEPDGCYLQFGEAGSGDAPELFFQEQGNSTSICRGEDGSIAASFMFAVKIIYQDGYWEMLADENGGQYYQPIADGTHHLPWDTGFLGMRCTYTKSNSTRFYFDDFYAGPPILDSIPPQISDLTILDSMNLQISFSEPLNLEVATDSSLYFLQPCNLIPETVTTDLQDPGKVVLGFSQCFENEASYMLQVAGLQDLAGNVMEPWNANFTYYQPVAYDVVINEIMADPSPAQGLPEEEYIELYNVSDYPVRLDQWTLEINGSAKEIDTTSIPPGEYLILVDQESKGIFEQYGRTASLSGLSLSNSGAELLLNDKHGNTIHSITYDPSWHNTANKQEGGFSLELCNPYNPCMDKGNWGSAQDGSGGTPGQENSIFTTEYQPIEIRNLCVENDSCIILYFNQAMQEDLNGAFDIGPFDIPIKSVGRLKSETGAYIAYLSVKLNSNTVYELDVLSGFLNCNGSVETNSLSTTFGLPGKADEGDLIINEVLFDPLDGCGEFVELYNHSSKPLNLNGYEILCVKERWPDPPDTSGGVITKDCMLLMPDEYMVITSSPELVSPCYFAEDPQRIIISEDFPALSNSGGIILLAGANGLIIDKMIYSEEMHFPMLQFTDGVTLERIHPSLLSGNPDSWHSAAQDCGFGTPTYKNSQYAETSGETDPVSLHPPVIHPGGGNGENSTCQISYRFPEEGSVGSISIFNAKGQPVRILVDRVLLGTEGMFSWDGSDDRGSICRQGIYIVLFEVLNLSGNVRKYKDVVVLRL